MSVAAGHRSAEKNAWNRRGPAVDETKRNRVPGPSLRARIIIMMKCVSQGVSVKPLHFLVLVILVLASAACSKAPSEGGGKVVATVNDYRMPLDDFQRQLHAELELTPEAKLTADVRKRFLNGLIRRELMIQEAKKRGLDTEPDFVRAIERHWESTLIRKLLAIKGAEIETRILVSEDEIATRYGKLKETDPDLPPLTGMHDQLYRLLKEEKKTAQLDDWIRRLWEKSRVEIDERLLTEPS